MNAYGSMTTMPMPTPARVRRAWVEVGEEVRRSAISAAATSLLLVVATHRSASLQFGLAVAGVAIVAAALVDVHERRLPNALVGIAAVAPLVGALVALDAHSAAWSCAGAVVAGGAMLTVRLARGVGMGDVKMAAAVGVSAGALLPVLAAVAIAVTALGAAVWGAAAGRRALPLGPALWLGWAAALALGSTGWWQ